MRLAGTILICVAALQAQHLTDSEASALIEKTRAHAIAYTVSLPDFICTQVVHRSEDPVGNNRWRRLDVLTVKLTFFGHVEDYKLMEINGKPTLLDFTNAGGPLSKGEFGTILLQLFHPKTAAEFRFKGFSTVHKRRVAVFTFKVDQAHTQYHLTYGNVSEGPNHIIAPYYGEFAVDLESAMVLRLVQHAILPPSFPIKQASMEIEYEYAEVAGIRYLLPLRAETNMSAGRYKTSNVAEFKDYRKFQSDSTVNFDK